MRTMKGALVGLFVSALGFAACDVRTGDGDLSFDFASGKAEDTWSRTYRLGSGGRLELVNVNGRIAAEPASGDTVELVGRRIAKAMSDEGAKDLLAKVEIREEVGDERIRVEVRVPRLRGFSRHEVRWEVKVPKGVSVNFQTTNGGVVLENLQGEVHAQTVNGGVVGKGLATDLVNASAVNGGVQIELAKSLSPDGRIELETVNGGVTLQLPETSRATINARVVNGGVSVTDLDVVTQGEHNRRRLDGTLNGGGARVNLETTNGGIKLSRTSTPSS